MSKAPRLSASSKIISASWIMARKTASTSDAPPVLRRSERNRVVANDGEDVSTRKKIQKRSATPTTSSGGKTKRIKKEESPEQSLHDVSSRIKSEKAEAPSPSKQAKTQVEKAADLQARKWKSYAQFANQSPFPDFQHPARAECKMAHQILASLHGARVRPTKVSAPTKTAGCGASTSVLDALVRTILSQNTSSKNSSRAKLSMDNVYRGSDKWEAIVEGGQAKLQKAIESGGLSVVKSKVIISILQQCKEKYRVYSLDHLFAASNDDAMKELLAFQGVGPKTASCVLLFCLQRESFAVDTHVHRITGLLGWRPKDATRDETHAHLDVMIPDEDKYGLHILLIAHGRQCDECKAGGKNLGKCELRKAFVNIK